jgi:hypothetical protein
MGLICSSALYRSLPFRQAYAYRAAGALAPAGDAWSGEVLGGPVAEARAGRGWPANVALHNPPCRNRVFPDLFAWRVSC